jgi:hypothetical protein
MSSDNLAHMTVDQASKTIEQTSKTQFEQVGGLGMQLVEMRDKDPQQYAAILKETTQMAQSDKSGAAASVLKELTLVGDLGDVQRGLKSGNAMTVESALGQLSKDENDGADRNFATGALAQGATDLGLMGRPGDAKGGQGLLLHQPGSAYGLELTPSGTSVYDWNSKKDVDGINPSRVLSNWDDSSTSPSSMQSEAARAVENLSHQDSFSRTASHDVENLSNLFQIAYSNGYEGRNGLDAVQQLASEVSRKEGKNISVGKDSQYDVLADLQIDFGNSDHLDTVFKTHH